MTSLSLSRAQPATAGALSRPRVWAWPLAALLGFPLGGYAANISVGAVDSVGAAIAGGLIAGVWSEPRNGSYLGGSSRGLGSPRRASA